MDTLLVSYRLVVSAPVQQLTGLQAALKSGGGCVRISEGCYVIETAQTPEAVYQDLKRFVYENDLLIVMRVSRPFFGQHMSDVVSWLNTHL